MPEKEIRIYDPGSPEQRQMKLAAAQNSTVDVGWIHTQGFPLGTNEQTAINTAEQAALAQYPVGFVLSDDVIYSNEAAANGEFLVEVTLAAPGVIGGL